MSELNDVLEFHKKFGLLTNARPGMLSHKKVQERLEFLQEELDEFNAAVDSKNLAGQADALIDLVYVALGTAIMMGLPWQALWQDVQKCNMAKVRGISHRNHAVDCVKPDGWVQPDTNTILYAFKNVGLEEFKDDDDIEKTNNI